MVEILQITANIIVLVGLAWLVMRETAGKYATVSAVRSLRDELLAALELTTETALVAETMANNAIDDIKRIETNIDDAGLSEPITEQEKYIRIGADLMREGVDTGHRVIVDALTRDGRLQRDIGPRKPRGPIVIDEFAAESDKDDDGGLPDIIKKMNERLGAELSINGLKGRNNG